MDHDHVREVIDRSCTQSLLERLLSDDLDAVERTEIERTLRALDDVRSVVRLQAAGENSGVEPIIRNSALAVLIDMLGAPALPIREWWGSGDPVLQFAAAGVLPTRAFADLVGPVLDQPTHPMLARVLASMDVGFEEPRWQSQKIRALTNARESVRAAAATCLLWDEPLAAEHALIDATRDLSVDVATEAVSTLMYYPTSAVVATLNAARQSPNETLAEASRTALERVLSDVADAVALAPGARALRSWEELVVHYQNEVASDPSLGLSTFDVAAAVSQPAAPSVPWNDDLRSELSDPNGVWAPKYKLLRMLDPTTIAAGDHRAVVEFLCEHIDPDVRSFAAQHLPGLAGGPLALLGMLDDPMITVAKSAMYALHDVVDADPNVSAIGARAWEAVADGTLTGTRASEALRTFVRHGLSRGPQFVETRLVGLLGDSRESMRSAALEQLMSLDATEALATALPMLAEAPEVTWSVHGTLLDAAFRFDLPIESLVLRRLAGIDHAWLCAAVAKLAPDA